MKGDRRPERQEGETRLLRWAESKEQKRYDGDSVQKCGNTSLHCLTCVLLGLTMNLNLSTAMVITVREDMKVARLGIVRTSLERKRGLRSRVT